jgi:hypothetical protein
MSGATFAIGLYFIFLKKGDLPCGLDTRGGRKITFNTGTPCFDPVMI